MVTKDMAWRIFITLDSRTGVRKVKSPDIRSMSLDWVGKEFSSDILSLKFYWPPHGDYNKGGFLHMRGFEKYNVMGEASSTLNSSTNILEKLVFFGKCPRKDVVYTTMIGRFGRPKPMPFWLGVWSIQQQTAKFGKEWYGSPTTGWKNGSQKTAPYSASTERF